jgi:hypothetical protein
MSSHRGRLGMRKQKVHRDCHEIRRIDVEPLVLLGGKCIDDFDILAFNSAEIL